MTYTYTELPNGFYGWVNKETGDLVTDPILRAILDKRGKEMFPGYEETSRAQWLADISELERLYN